MERKLRLVEKQRHLPSSSTCSPMDELLYRRFSVQRLFDRVFALHDGNDNGGKRKQEKEHGKQSEKQFGERVWRSTVNMLRDLLTLLCFLIEFSRGCIGHMDVNLVSSKRQMQEQLWDVSYSQRKRWRSLCLLTTVRHW